MLSKCADEGIKIDLAQVPAVVKAAIEKEIAGGTIGEIVKKGRWQSVHAVECATIYGKNTQIHRNWHYCDR